jgi:hypothetical protein
LAERDGFEPSVWAFHTIRLRGSLAAESAVAATAKAVIAWMKANADRLAFNDAPRFGSVAAEFDVGLETCALMRPWKEGRVAICFSQLRLTPAFVELADRQELLNRLNALPGQASKRGKFRAATELAYAIERAPRTRPAEANWRRHNPPGRSSGMPASRGENFSVTAKRL